ncbi:HAD family hydrolase [Labrys wisconsinensis]|uniref:phosphoglycolate phosphatase n=1 Tax=Labrys wisconsinensis TaxID=425677 RepID=A0ABU0J8Y3_9HYPH|nr:HAD family hydrolase [Labrys wisconsinensis]MDQ0470733.1 phosphoglycolate phosphatase [Labrys wisconsinensis]
MPLRAILFDKDGTFVDFHSTWSPAAHAVMRRLAAGDEDKLRQLIEVNHFDVETGLIRSTSPMIAQSSADYGVTWASVLGVAADAAFFSRMDGMFREEGLATVAPIGEPTLMLAELRREGYALGVITNDSEAGARAQCDKLGLTAWFDAIIGYDSGHGRKPEPGPILACARRFGVAPGETALVGDTLHDLHAARAAGATAIGVLSGFAGEAELAEHADHVLPDIMALPALLRRLRA